MSASRKMVLCLALAGVVLAWGSASYGALEVDERLTDTAQVRSATNNAPFLGADSHPEVLAGVNFHYGSGAVAAEATLNGIAFDNIDLNPVNGEVGYTIEANAAGVTLTVDIGGTADMPGGRTQSAGITGPDATVANAVASHIRYVSPNRGSDHTPNLLTFGGLGADRNVYVQLIGGDAGWSGNIEIYVNDSETAVGTWTSAGDGVNTAGFTGFFTAADADGNLKLDLLGVVHFSGYCGAMIIGEFPGGLPIEARAGGPYEMVPDGEITLDGTASNGGPGAEITSYEWDIAGVAARTGAEVTLTFDDLVAMGLGWGEFPVTLTITDDLEGTDTDETTLLINPTISVQHSTAYGTFTVADDDLISEGADTFAAIDLTSGGTMTWAGVNIGNLNDGIIYLDDDPVNNRNKTDEAFGAVEGTVIEITLDTTTNTQGYNITSFVSLSEWTDLRMRQAFTIEASVVGSEDYFPVADVPTTPYTVPHGFGEIQVAISGPEGGALATGVDKLRVTLHNAGGLETMYREWDAFGTPTGPAVADADGPYIVNEGGTVTLNGTASLPGAAATGITAYEWDLDDDGEFDDATGATPEVSYDDLAALGLGTGGHTITLRITDDAAGTATDTADLYINPNIAWSLAANGAFGAAADDLINEGQPSLMDLIQTEGSPIYESSPTALNNGTVYGDGGTGNTDGMRAFAPSEGAVVVVTLDTSTNTQGYNIGSVVSLTGISAGNARTSQKYLLEASKVGTDDFEFVAFVERLYDVGGESQAVITAPGGTVLATGVNQLRFTFYQLGPAGYEVMIYREIDVFGTGGPALAYAGGPYNLGPGRTIQLDGTASVAGVGATSIAAYEWDLDGDGQYDDAAGPNPSVAYDDVLLSLGIGEHEISLQVTDDQGGTATGTATLSVKRIIDERLSDTWQIATAPFEGGEAIAGVNIFYSSGAYGTGTQVAGGETFQGVAFDNIDASGIAEPTGPIAVEANKAGITLDLMLGHGGDASGRSKTANITGTDADVLNAVAHDFYYLSAPANGHAPTVLTFGGLGAGWNCYVQLIGGSNGWQGRPEIHVNGEYLDTWTSVPAGATNGASLAGFYATADGSGELAIELIIPDGTAPFAGLCGVILHGSAPTVVADAGGPYQAGIGGSVTFDATGSYDPQGGAIVSYEWDLDGVGDFDDGDTAEVTKTHAELLAMGLSHGSNTVRLRVTDDQDESAIGSATVSLLGGIALAGETEINIGVPVLLTITVNPPAGPAGVTIALDFNDLVLDIEPLNPLLAPGESEVVLTVMGLDLGQATVAISAEGYADAAAQYTVSEVSTVPGDVNNDGCVNVADLLTVRNNLGNEGSDIFPTTADVTGGDPDGGDGIVNVADLLFVRNRLGDGPNCP